MRIAMSACEVPVIMFLMKSLCPGASIMVNENFSVCAPSSVVSHLHYYYNHHYRRRHRRRHYHVMRVTAVLGCTGRHPSRRNFSGTRWVGRWSEHIQI